MNIIRILLLVVLLGVVPARAQYIVYDPNLHLQLTIQQNEDMLKFIEMINNQVYQINMLIAQWQQIQYYIQIFGDPAMILQVLGIDGIELDVNMPGLGETLANLRTLAAGIESIKYDANGLYHNIGDVYVTVNGTRVSRLEDLYKPFAAINKTTQNFSAVYDDVSSRRAALKKQIAATSKKLQSATTAAECQKLTGALVGLNGTLAAADREVDLALGQSVIQDIENRNDREKQQQAKAEEMAAEFADAMKHYGETVKLLTEPPLFPESKR